MLCETAFPYRAGETDDGAKLGYLRKTYCDIPRALSVAILSLPSTILMRSIENLVFDNGQRPQQVNRVQADRAQAI